MPLQFSGGIGATELSLFLHYSLISEDKACASTVDALCVGGCHSLFCAIHHRTTEDCRWPLQSSGSIGATALSLFPHYSRISEDTARTSTDGALCVGGFQSNTSAKSPLTNRETVSSRLTCPLALH
jgi:hypothetical protein